MKAGLNRVAITTLTGSWVLWDAVRFVAPEDTRLAAVEDFVLPRPASMSSNWSGTTGRPCNQWPCGSFTAGTASESEVRIGDRPPQRLHLHSGLQDVECLAPPVEKNETLPVALSVGSGSPLRSEVSLRPVRKWEVYILMHSHNDIGYTDIQPNIAKKQAHNVVRALELIEKTKDYPAGARFKWNLEVLMPYEDFRQVATPEQMRQFERAVRDGFIGVDAMYANLLTGVCRGEELLRQFTFATALGRRCGVKVDSMSISDVPGLTWGVVPALAQNGVKYLSDGPNYLDRIGYARVTWEDKPFWWVGPDGREKVLYWAPYFGYAFGHTIDHVTDAVQTDLRHLVAEHYPYDIVQMRWSKGDNGLPDERVMDEVRQWNARHAYPRLIIATTSEMFHAFEQRYGDKLPTFRGDFTPYWEDGAGSGAAETAINRHTADRLSQAETLWALRGAGPYPASDFAAAWKNVALWSEHTLGALQQHQRAQPALRQDAVEIQAGLGPRRPAAIAETHGAGPGSRRRRLGREAVRVRRLQHLFVAADGPGQAAQADRGQQRLRPTRAARAEPAIERRRIGLPGQRRAPAGREAIHRRGSRAGWRRRPCRRQFPHHATAEC